MPFTGPCFSFSCNESNTNLEALGTVFLHFSLLPPLLQGSPRCAYCSGHHGQGAGPCTRHLLLPHLSRIGWIPLSYTRVDRSPRQHISRDLKSDVSISIDTVNVVSCSLTMELLHLSLSCFQIQQWKIGMLYIGTLKFQSSYFDHLYWQQIYLL